MNETEFENSEPPSRGLGRVAVVHNVVSDDAVEEDGEPPSHAADAEVAETAALIARSLERSGAEVMVCGVADDVEQVVARLKAQGVQRVFNLVEAVGGDASRESEFVDALERARLPYTGNGTTILKAAFHKHVARQILGACNIPIPRGYECWSVADVPLDGYPYFAKPSRADGSIGIDQGSLVKTPEAARDRVAWLLRTLGGPVLMEEYLPGAEVNVALLPVDDQLVGVATAIDFSAYSDDLVPVVTYNCKWVPGTPEYNCRSVPAAEIVPRWQIDEAIRVARAAFLTLGGTGYGRVDLRCDAQGHPRVIDVNPNPDLHPEAGLAVAAQSIRVDWDTLIAFITTGASLKDAHVRSPHHSSRPRATRSPAHPG